MADWLAQIGELPALLLMLSLGVVMVLDAIPLIGVLVPGDVAVLAAVDARGPGGGVLVVGSVVLGCLGGWSLTFLAGRHLGTRIRRGRIGAWIGESRWATAERVVSRGGSRVVVMAPFLPVLNALVPLAAGGLRMSYRRFVACAGLGAALWAGLYVVLGMVAAALGDLLPGESFATYGTLAIGLTFGWIALLAGRRQLRAAAADPQPAGPPSAAGPLMGADPPPAAGPAVRRASTGPRLVVAVAGITRPRRDRRRHRPSTRPASAAGRSRWLVGSSSNSRLPPRAARRAIPARVRSPAKRRVPTRSWRPPWDAAAATACQG